MKDEYLLLPCTPQLDDDYKIEMEEREKHRGHWDDYEYNAADFDE